MNGKPRPIPDATTIAAHVGRFSWLASIGGKIDGDRRDCRHRLDGRRAGRRTHRSADRHPAGHDMASLRISFAQS